MKTYGGPELIHRLFCNKGLWAPLPRTVSFITTYYFSIPVPASSGVYLMPERIWLTKHILTVCFADEAAANTKSSRVEYQQLLPHMARAWLLPNKGYVGRYSSRCGGAPRGKRLSIEVCRNNSQKETAVSQPILLKVVLIINISNQHFWQVFPDGLSVLRGMNSMRTDTWWKSFRRKTTD